MYNTLDTLYQHDRYLPAIAAPMLPHQ